MLGQVLVDLGEELELGPEDLDEELELGPEDLDE